MMGLLGNVAEVGELRPQLMTSEFVIVFSELLYSTSDGIEVLPLFLLSGIILQTKLAFGDVRLATTQLVFSLTSCRTDQIVGRSKNPIEMMF